MATKYMERLQIPEGFEQMLHDLVKAILREQPKDINRFCFNYFIAKKNNEPMPEVIERNDFGVQREEEKENQMVDQGIGNVNEKYDESAKKDRSMTMSKEHLKTEESNQTIKGVIGEFYENTRNDIINEFDGDK